MGGKRKVLVGTIRSPYEYGSMWRSGGRQNLKGFEAAWQLA
jgi:hypothetical protein